MGLPRTAEAMLLLEAGRRRRGGGAGGSEQIGDGLSSRGRPRGSDRRDARPSATPSGEPAARFHRRWAAPGRTSSARTSWCRAARSRRWCAALARSAAELDLPIPVFGHAGDGNLHPNILFDRRHPGELERVEAAADRDLPGGDRARRHLERRARHRHAQARVPRGRPRRGRGRADGRDQASVRSARPAQPGQGLPQQPGSDHSGFLTALPSLEGLTPG